MSFLSPSATLHVLTAGCRRIKCVAGCFNWNCINDKINQDTKCGLTNDYTATSSLCVCSWLKAFFLLHNRKERASGILGPCRTFTYLCGTNAGFNYVENLWKNHIFGFTVCWWSTFRQEITCESWCILCE